MINKFNTSKIIFIIIFILFIINEVGLNADDKKLSSTTKLLISNWKKDSLSCLGFRNKITTIKVIEQMRIFPYKYNEIIDILGFPYAIYQNVPCLIDIKGKNLTFCNRLIYNADLYCKNDTVFMNKNRIILRIDIDCRNDSVTKYDIIDLE